jgi:hypothetical protein
MSARPGLLFQPTPVRATDRHTDQLGVSDDTPHPPHGSSFLATELARSGSHLRHASSVSTRPFDSTQGLRRGRAALLAERFGAYGALARRAVPQLNRGQHPQPLHAVEPCPLMSAHLSRRHALTPFLITEHTESRRPPCRFATGVFAIQYLNSAIALHHLCPPVRGFFLQPTPVRSLLPAVPGRPLPRRHEERPVVALRGKRLSSPRSTRSHEEHRGASRQTSFLHHPATQRGVFDRAHRALRASLWSRPGTSAPGRGTSSSAVSPQRPPLRRAVVICGHPCLSVVHASCFSRGRRSTLLAERLG